MNPVELLRLIQFLQIIAQQIEETLYEVELESFPIKLARMTGLFHLGSMTQNRVRSVLREIAVCGLCSLEKTRIAIGKTSLDNWQDLSKCINLDMRNKDQRWNQLDRFLSERHDLYEKFSEMVDRSLLDKTVSLNETLMRNFSKPTISTLREWGCRLNRVQQNYLDEEIIYAFQDEFKLNKVNIERFGKTFIDSYIKEKSRGRLRSEAVSLPVLAERVCAKLRITRNKFRDLLEDFYDKHRSTMWLGSGVIRTYAYEGFVIEEQSILEVIGNGPWFLREFCYKKSGLPQYVVDKVPRRFIRIERELLEGVEDQHARRDEV